MFGGKLYTLFTGRSSRWPKVRDAYLRLSPDCCVCRRPAETVHHVVPFAVAPARELDPTNFASVCDACHLAYGHGGSWNTWNENFWQVVTRCKFSLIHDPNRTGEYKAVK